YEWLIKPSDPVKYGQPVSEENLTGPTSATRVWVADVNGDGKLALIVGDSANLVSTWKSVSAEDVKTKFTAWQNAAAAASKELSSETGDQTKRAKANEEFIK